MDEVEIIMHSEALKLQEKEIRKKHNVMPEDEYRKKLFNKARAYGREFELTMIFAKYDNLLKNCTNDKERQHIAILGHVEVHKLLEEEHTLFSQGFKIMDGIK